jgi:hypothetical protein
MVTNTIWASIPTEIWFEILERTCVDINDAEELWLSVRPVSRQFRDIVESHFLKICLPRFSISIPLPCRDPDTGATKWRTAFYQSQMSMSLGGMTPDKRRATFVSPTEIKSSEGTMMDLEQLKERNLLPKTRLLDSLPWVYTGKIMSAGRPLEAPKDTEWDEQQKRWIWQLDWRKMVTQFYKARTEARAKSRKPLQPMNKSRHTRTQK